MALSTASDVELWAQACQSDFSAFEEIVKRHQNLLCSVAYSRCGDFAVSEDLAQEAFWVAWNSRDSLRDPARLSAWLCGIVRNLAADATRRRKSRREEAATDELDSVSSSDIDPSESAISREEEELVWDSLQEIPETYREPLVLFYRDERSVAEVAIALDLSEDAVKQRLSRGRTMLRDRVSALVEGALQQTRPTTAFTMAVMAGITASAAGKSAMAGGSVAASSAVLATAAKATVPGLLGSLLGGGLGLLGGYLGIAAPAQLAPTRTERDFLMRSATRTTVVSLGLVVLFLVATFQRAKFSHPTWLMLTMGWVIVLNLYIMVEIAWIARKVRRIRAETSPETDPNINPLKTWIERQKSSYEPRHYRSTWELLGIPLVHINAQLPSDNPQAPKPWTVGWVAIGDKARGLIALGGIAQGLIAFGGVSIGLITLGGVAIGGLALGGTALGGLAIGGLAIGWQAAGGGALGWDLAVGGGACAHRAAHGGAAYASDFAVGGAAKAAHANDELAKEALASEPLVRGAEWLSQNHSTALVSYLVSLGVLILLISWATTRRKKPAVHSAE
jgi:zinc protease